MGNKNSVYVDVNLKDGFLSDALNTHNKYRLIHNCQPLTHAEDLSELAHKIAFYISTRNKDLRGRLTKDRIENALGENTTVKILTRDQDYSDFTNFTQLLWKNSREVGFGKVKAKNRVIVVGCYRPAGNIKGQYQQNVLPPLQKSGCCSCY
ncbi:Golgi-associated plant pathogenesis-related protein 1-like isoform X2 [Mytilus trossulus]|uniref:Golgi-associated plant pathogenesis-related protein 1-like isoform X2 n=1 Tax=Mytilus trossulus TaxID=6551 RepID=UPI0030046A11